MAESIRDQFLDKGLIKKNETPEAKRAAARAVEPPVEEKGSPMAFEAPARGVIVDSQRKPLVARQCVDCGATLRSTQDRALRCAECAADSG